MEQRGMCVIRMTVLFVAACAFQCGADLWAGSIYTWTDQYHVVHITDTPPPSGVAVDNVMNSLPESQPRARPESQPPQSIGSREIQQAEQQARQASQKLEQSEKHARQVKEEAERIIQESKQYIDSHDNNQYMRTAHKYQLRQARNAILASEAKVQEAADQLKHAEQDAEAARQQLKQEQDFESLIQSK